MSDKYWLDPYKIWFLQCAFIGFWAAIYIGILYVIIHFIIKFW